MGPTITGDVSLAAHTTLALGGPAKHWCEVESVEGLREALAWARDRGVPARILGGGSNLVVADAGVDALVVRIAIRGTTWSSPADGVCEATVQAGEVWDAFVAAAVSRNLAGVECLSGIPGSVGATPVQNVGAYGQAVADTIVEVTALDRVTGEVNSVPAKDCGFAYRSSRFKQDPERHVVLSVRFRLREGKPATPRYPELSRALEGKDGSVAALRETVIALRRSKSMVIDPGDDNRHSAGSFFVNPVVSRTQAEVVVQTALDQGWAATASDIPCFEQPSGECKMAAAWLIEHAGFPRGTRCGPVGQSSNHALALVHYGGGSTAQLLALAREIRDAVQTRFAIRLQHEPTFWGVAL